MDVFLDFDWKVGWRSSASRIDARRGETLADVPSDTGRFSGCLVLAAAGGQHCRQQNDQPHGLDAWPGPAAGASASALLRCRNCPTYVYIEALTRT